MLLKKQFHDWFSLAAKLSWKLPDRPCCCALRYSLLLTLSWYSGFEDGSEKVTEVPGLKPLLPLALLFNSFSSWSCFKLWPYLVLQWHEEGMQKKGRKVRGFATAESTLSFLWREGTEASHRMVVIASSLRCINLRWLLIWGDQPFFQPAMLLTDFSKGTWRHAPLKCYQQRLPYFCLLLWLSSNCDILVLLSVTAFVVIRA